MWTSVLAVIGGGVFGFVWYRVVGCSGGGCPITSNPYLSIIFGALMGLVLAGK